MTDKATLNIIVLHEASTIQNNNPIAQNDVTRTAVNKTVNGNALANDSDPDGDPLTITAATQGTQPITLGSATQVSGKDKNGNIVPNAGSIIINADGTYTFTPAPDFIGTIDDISYTISDGKSGTSEAVIKITVNEDSANNVYANDDAYVSTGSSITGENILTNDSDPEGNSFSVTKLTYLNEFGYEKAVTLNTPTKI